jgi:hypothetical protein
MKILIALFHSNSSMHAKATANEVGVGVVALYSLVALKLPVCLNCLERFRFGR